MQLEDGSLCLLDVGRARKEPAPRERWFVKDLAALYVSAPGSISPRERLRFLAGWLTHRRAARPDLRDRRSQLRRWSRVVVAKGRRMAQHAPRSSDPEGAERAARDVEGSSDSTRRGPDA